MLADRWTDAFREVACMAVGDCGSPSPGDAPDVPGVLTAGDAAAPRTVREAVHEGRRAACAVDAARLHPGPGLA